MEPVNTDSRRMPVFGKRSLRHPLLIKFRRLMHDFHSVLERYPLIFIPLSRLRVRMGLSDVEIINERTEFVIGGFPRSGNTFAYHAFKFAQHRSVVTAHHLHYSAHVILGARKGLPTLVLVRMPEDAVLSLVIRASYSLSIKQALEDYIRFYTRIKPYHSRYVVAPFDDVTRNFGGVIERINQRFSTTFSPFEHNEENVREVFRLVEQDDLQNTGRMEVTETTVARPSSERERMKSVLQREFEKEDLKDLLARAQALYRDFTAQPS